MHMAKTCVSSPRFLSLKACSEISHRKFCFLPFVQEIVLIQYHLEKTTIFEEKTKIRHGHEMHFKGRYILYHLADCCDLISAFQFHTTTIAYPYPRELNAVKDRTCCLP